MTGGWPAYQKTAELYDPATGTFTATYSMAVGRTDHTATLLPNGKVLVVGGQSNEDQGKFPSPVTSSAELYLP
jgi:hypothetical protein